MLRISSPQQKWEYSRRKQTEPNGGHRCATSNALCHLIFLTATHCSGNHLTQDYRPNMQKGRMPSQLLPYVALSHRMFYMHKIVQKDTQDWSRPGLATLNSPMHILHTLLSFPKCPCYFQPSSLGMWQSLGPLTAHGTPNHLQTRSSQEASLITPHPLRAYDSPPCPPFHSCSPTSTWHISTK